MLFTEPPKERHRSGPQRTGRKKRPTARQERKPRTAKAKPKKKKDRTKKPKPYKAPPLTTHEQILYDKYTLGKMGATYDDNGFASL